MNCRASKKLMMPYVEGMLDGDSKSQFEQHLNSCETCREESKAIGRMKKVLQSAAPEAVEPASDLWARVNAKIQPVQPTRAPRPWWVSVPAVGAVAMLLIGIATIPIFLRLSSEMMPASSKASREMGGMGAPGMKGGMPGMAPAPPSAGLVMSGPLAKAKVNAPVPRGKTPASTGPAMMARVPSVDSYSLDERVPIASNREGLQKESESKFNVVVPVPRASGSAKTRLALPTEPARMAKVSPYEGLEYGTGRVDNEKLSMAAPHSPDMSAKSELLLDNKGLPKAAPLSGGGMPGGPTAVSDSMNATVPAPGMAGMPGGPELSKPNRSVDIVKSAPGMGAMSQATAPMKGDANQARSKQLARNDKDSLVIATSDGVLAALERQMTSGEKDAAIALANRLHTMTKVDQKTWYRLGEIEEKLGRKTRALVAYRKSTDGPDKQISRKASLQIKRLEK